MRISKKRENDWDRLFDKSSVYVMERRGFSFFSLLKKPSKIEIAMSRIRGSCRFDVVRILYDHDG